MPPPITSTLAATGEAEAAGEEEEAAVAASAGESIMAAEWKRRVRSVSQTEDGTVESAGGMSRQHAAWL